MDDDRNATERAIFGIAAEQARRLAVLKLDTVTDRAPCLEQAREHLQRIDVAEGSATLAEKARAAAIAYHGVANASVKDETRKCSCGQCQPCLTKAALVPIRDALLLYCLARGGHRDRKACIRMLQDALGGVWSDVIQSQLLNAYWHLMGGIPGAFRSHNSSSGRLRGKTAPPKTPVEDYAWALTGPDSAAMPDARGAPDAFDALDAPGRLKPQTLQDSVDTPDASMPHAPQDASDGPPPEGARVTSDGPDVPDAHCDPRRRGGRGPGVRGLLVPPRTSPEQVGAEPFRLVGNSNMYLTCGFVPVGLACEDSLKVQINSLLSQMVPAYSGPALCTNCAAALKVRLEELPREQLWSGAGAELTARVLGVLSSVRARLATSADVQWGCGEAMLRLLRRRGDALALHTLAAPADPSSATVAELDAKISKQVLDALLASREAWGGPVCRKEELQLLALTQKLPTLIAVVADDGNAIEEVLDELHNSLFWCLIGCLPYAASRDSQWHEHTKELVRSIAQQRTALADTVFLETEFWARKAWTRKTMMTMEWPDNLEMQTRCMLACLLFGVERAVFSSLKDSFDCKWLKSACRAAQALHDLELLDTEEARGIVEVLLDWRRDERAQRLFDADPQGSLQGDYVGTLGSLLRGRLLEGACDETPGGGWEATHVPIAVDAILDIGRRGPPALTSASLAALGAICEGTEPPAWPLEPLPGLVHC